MARRKYFSESVTIGAAAATSLLTLMQGSVGVWSDADSWIGVGGSITPAGQILYMGHDANVRNAAGGGNYQGVPVQPGQPFALQDFRNAAGVIDPSSIFCYSVPGDTLGIVFVGV